MSEAGARSARVRVQRDPRLICRHFNPGCSPRQKTSLPFSAFGAFAPLPFSAHAYGFGHFGHFGHGGGAIGLVLVVVLVLAVVAIVKSAEKR